jgi:peroxiredoxin
MKPNATRNLLLILSLLLLASPSLLARDGNGRNRRAPDFSLLDGQGKKVALGDYRGKVILLQFFQTGCPTCQREAPLLEELYQAYREKGLILIGISHDGGGAEAVNKFAEKFSLTYPLLLGDLEVAVRYVGVTPQRPSFKIPYYFVIDPEGTIRKEFTPSDNPEFLRDEKGWLERAIEEALAGFPPPSPGDDSLPR